MRFAARRSGRTSTRSRSAFLGSLLVAALATPILRGDETRLVTTLDGNVPLSGEGSSLSADGRFVLFLSTYSSYVPDDTNGSRDHFVRDLELGTVDRVNVADDGSEESIGSSYFNYDLNISADGRFVAFVSDELDDPAGHDGPDVFLRDRVDRRTILVSHTLDGTYGIGGAYQPRVTRDGSRVLFLSQSDDLVDGDTNGREDVFEWERATGAIRRVSTDSQGGQIDVDCGYGVRASADGNVVAFEIYEWRGLSILYSHTYVKDLSTGILERVDAYASGGGFADESYVSDMSADGRFVLLVTEEPLDAADTNSNYDGYLRDRSLGTTERVTLGTGRVELEGLQYASTLSDDARFVAFSTTADASGDDSNGVSDGFRFDRDSGVALRISLGPGDRSTHVGAGAGPMSADGRVVLFSTWSDDLWPGDDDLAYDAFVRTLSDIAAAWTNYGAGFAGHFGIPDLTLDAPPRRTSTVELHVADSSGQFTVSVLFVGLASADWSTSLGGTLLVDPFASLALPLSPWDNAIPWTVPSGGDLPGLHLYLQALELDPWAAKGVSFTAGLDATIGD
jgi:Tol biopolymer transport system component